MRGWWQHTRSPHSEGVPRIVPQIWMWRSIHICGTIRGPVRHDTRYRWHDTRSSVAQYEVPSHWFHSCGTIRGTMWHNTRSYAARYEVQCGTIRGPMRHNTRYSLAARYEVLDTKSRTKFFQFRWFIDPCDPNQLYHTSLLSKIWDLNERKFFGEQSL